MEEWDEIRDLATMALIGVGVAIVLSNVNKLTAIVAPIDTTIPVTGTPQPPTAKCASFLKPPEVQGGECEDECGANGTAETCLACETECVPGRKYQHLYPGGEAAVPAEDSSGDGDGEDDDNDDNDDNDDSPDHGENAEEYDEDSPAAKKLADRINKGQI